MIFVGLRVFFVELRVTNNRGLFHEVTRRSHEDPRRINDVIPEFLNVLYIFKYLTDILLCRCELCFANLY
jgi:hypothetical protein